MVEVNNWACKVAFTNFAMMLRGLANTWLESQVILKNIKGDREKWSIIKPDFNAGFTIESDDRLILDGLAFLAMKPSEKVRYYFGRLNKTYQIIANAYRVYSNTPNEPNPGNDGKIDIA